MQLKGVPLPVKDELSSQYEHKGKQDKEMARGGLLKIDSLAEAADACIYRSQEMARAGRYRRPSSGSSIPSGRLSTMRFKPSIYKPVNQPATIPSR